MLGSGHWTVYSVHCPLDNEGTIIIISSNIPNGPKRPLGVNYSLKAKQLDLVKLVNLEKLERNQSV